jgi:hypothetical protein
MNSIHKTAIENQHQQSSYINKLVSPVASSAFKKISDNISKSFNKLVKTSSNSQVEQTPIKLVSFRKVGGYADYLDSRMPELYANKHVQ